MPSGQDPATILVVEDDEVLGQVLGRVLTQDGHAVVYARNASDALHHVKEQPPQLVLLDTFLRDGKGRELAETLRADDAGLPVILLTSHPATEADFPRSTVGLVTKSIDLPDLRRTVNSALAAGRLVQPATGRRDQNSTPAALPEPAAVQPIAPATPGRIETQPGTVNEQSSRIAKEPSMRVFNSTGFKIAGALLVALVLVLGLAAANGSVRLPWAGQPEGEKDLAVTATDADDPHQSVQLVEGKPHTLFLPDDVRNSLGIRKAGIDIIYTTKKPTRTRPLTMPGSTSFDPPRLMRVRARFAASPSTAEVIEIGQITDDPTQIGKTRTVSRELRPGDKVIKGNLLAVLSSVDVGNKKNDLIDSIYQLAFDENVYKRAQARSDAVPEVNILNALQNMQRDKNNINRAVSTLRTWGIPEEDIQAARDEAENVKKRKGEHDKSKDALWARVEIRAPEDGIIVERNANLRENIDNTLNLFQVANVDKLLVTTHVPEDDLPELERLQSSSHEKMRWTVRTVGSPPIPGYIDDIGYLIDPNDHTAIVRGHIDNQDGRIRATQFVTATVQLPPPPDVVEIPIDSVIDDGQQSVIFVQTDAAKQYYTMRRIQLLRRFDKTAFARSKPFKKKEQATPEEIELGLLPKEPLLPGERILVSGVGELKAVLIDKESQPKKHASNAG